MTCHRLLKTLTVALLLGTISCTAQNPADLEQNKREGISFLLENGKKPGVVTTSSGLQYQILKEGTGEKPAATDFVTVNYKGSLITGKMFDSGEGIGFPLNGVIPGWTEGLQHMQTGAQYRFFIPAPLAYGEKGIGPIPPHATLIFDVELVKIGR